MTAQQKHIVVTNNYTFTAYNYRKNVLTALHEMGYRVTVLAPPDEYVPLLEGLGVCEVLPLKFMTAKQVTPVRDVLLTFELWLYYRRLRPDMVLHYTVKPNIWGSLAARWLGLRSMNVVTGLGYTFLTRGRLKQLVRRLYRYALRESQCIVFHNDEDAELFRRLKLADPTLCHVIKGSGVNTTHFAPPEGYVPAAVRRFLFIGRLIQDKGIAEYIEAARMLRSRGIAAECLVAGDWGMTNPSVMSREVFEEAERDGLIRYLGHVMDVRPDIAACDVVVLPSYREGLSKSLLEGMAMARPLLTTDTPGCRDVVQGGENGILVPIKSATALADAMQRFCEMPDTELLQMGAAGRRIVLEQFDDRVILGRYLSHIKNVIGA
jgi:glycosyltransferase involved in cell wall biosynthesis